MPLGGNEGNEGLRDLCLDILDYFPPPSSPQIDWKNLLENCSKTKKEQQKNLLEN